MPSPPGVESRLLGRVTDLQRAALPPVDRSTFVRSSWRGMCSGLVCALATCFYPQSRHDLLRAFRLPRPTRALLIGAGLAYWVNFGAFNVALEHTSISHAALFESCSSLYMVAAQACTGARLPTLHRVGVLVGVLGAVATLAEQQEGGGGLSASALGDIAALAAGAGAAVYLVLAEKLRTSIDVLAFYALLQLQFAVLCLAAAAVLDSVPPSFAEPLDAQHGILGWLQPTPARLGAQLWLALIVDLAGNFGFIAVMKYVPALTVAAAMLLGPLTSTLEGIAVGVDQLPGPWTLAGALLITAGSGLITFASNEHRTTTVAIE